MNIESEKSPRATDRTSFQVYSSVHKRFKQYCDDRPVPKVMIDVGSRLLEWFLRQDDRVKSAVLADVDLGMEEHYATALDRLADDMRQSARDRLAETNAGEDATKQDFTRAGLAKATGEDKPKSIQRKKPGRR